MLFARAKPTLVGSRISSTSRSACSACLQRVVAARVVDDDDVVGTPALPLERFEALAQQRAAVPVDDQDRHRHAALVPEVSVRGWRISKTSSLTGTLELGADRASPPGGGPDRARSPLKTSSSTRQRGAAGRQVVDRSVDLQAEHRVLGRRDAVNETDRPQPPTGIRQHLAREELAALSRPADQHAPRAAALRDRGVRHQPERQPAGHDRHQQEDRIDDEDAAREPLEPIQIRGGQHRAGRPADDRAANRGDIADAEREPRPPIQARRIVRRELAHDHDRQRRGEGRQKDAERFPLESEPIGACSSRPSPARDRRAPPPRASGSAWRAGAR